MTRKMTALIAATAFAITAGSAAADTGFEVDFKFDPLAPVETTYSAFETTAKAACRIGYVEAGGLARQAKIQKACQENLMEEAVKSTGLVALAAYHAEQTGEDVSTRQLARSEW